jgi:ankyrin repeat protein
MAIRPATFHHPEHEGSVTTNDSLNSLEKRAHGGDMEAIKYLYNHERARLFQPINVFKDTLIGIAARRRKLTKDIIMQLCELDSNLVLTRNVNGDAPIHIAAKDLKMKDIFALNESYPEILMVQNNDRETALDIAEKGEKKALQETLSKISKDLSRNMEQLSITLNRYCNNEKSSILTNHTVSTKAPF